MGNNVIIGIVIAIIIVAIVVFLVSYLMKKNQDRLDALEKRKEELFDLPVIEEVDDVKNASGWAKPKYLS